MSDAVSSMGTTFQWNSEAVAEIKSITGPNQKVDTFDVTHYGSLNYYREFLATFIDGGEVGLDCNFIYTDTNGQVAMYTDFQARNIKECVITLSDGTTLTFDALITNWVNNQPLDGVLGLALTLKVSGEVAIVFGA